MDSTMPSDGPLLREACGEAAEAAARKARACGEAAARKGASAVGHRLRGKGKNLLKKLINKDNLLISVAVGSHLVLLRRRLQKKNKILKKIKHKQTSKNAVLSVCFPIYIM